MMRSANIGDTYFSKKEKFTLLERSENGLQFVVHVESLTPEEESSLVGLSDNEVQQIEIDTMTKEKKGLLEIIKGWFKK